MHDDAPFDLPLASARQLLIARLATDQSYQRLASAQDVTDVLARPGQHCLFIPGEPLQNQRTSDDALILPELRHAFQYAFDCAVIDDRIEAVLRDRYRALKVPHLLFFCGPDVLGSIEKVRDWP
ncbi:MAG: hydrogenase accessory protein, partial [Tabrizicola sp.]|nr:hydrogenase accessory protein [Tabrizicola sp.]